MKYTLYGKKLRYKGFRMDISIIAVCFLIGVAMLMGLIFREEVYWFLWGALCMGCVLNILMAVKSFTYKHISGTVVCVIAAVILAVTAALTVIRLL